MRAPITEADVETLDLSTPDPQQAAGRLLAWAEDPHPDDAVSPRELLVLAGEQLELAGDTAGAEDLYRRAASAAGHASIDPRSHLVALLLDRGERDEALTLDRELRRSRPADAATYEYMGEVWSAHGEDGRALGWVTRGIGVHEQGPGFSQTDLAMLCLKRWEVRERQGQEPDGYDVVGIGMRERLDRAQEEHPPVD